MDIDQDIMKHFRKRMDMHYDENDEDRLEAVKNTVRVVEALQTAILERYYAGSSSELSVDARLVYDHLDEVREYLSEVEENLG